MKFDQLPKHLIFELTAKCNYRCPFCYCVWHEFPELAEPERNTDFWLALLDRCAEYGIHEILFTGGEALLRPDLSELLTYARKRLPDASLGVFTNAALMTEDFLRFCKKKKIRLAVSLPGLSTYGSMTGTRRRCYRTLEWIERASELDWPVSVSLTATRTNRKEFADMYCAAALSGAKNIQLGTMMPEGRGREHSELALTSSEWEALKAEIRALPGNGVPYDFCSEILCECRPHPEEILKRFGSSQRFACKGGLEFGVIGPNGTFRKCLHTVESSVLPLE